MPFGGVRIAQAGAGVEADLILPQNGGPVTTEPWGESSTSSQRLAEEPRGCLG
jgi:hypothetical protein